MNNHAVFPSSLTKSLLYAKILFSLQWDKMNSRRLKLNFGLFCVFLNRYLKVDI